jgi:hypothetical protein
VRLGLHPGVGARYYGRSHDLPADRAQAKLAELSLRRGEATAP